MRKISILIIACYGVSYSACIPQVNKSKPSVGIPGGQFNDCKIESKISFCNPTKGEQNYMTRHHIFNKALWIDVLDKGLNHADYGFNEAKSRVKEIMRYAGASEAVINDVDQNGKACNSETNKWLTWLPVNLSLGPAPQDRSFDPGSDFDNWALIIVSDQNVKRAFENIYTAIINYDNDEIAANLAKLPVVKIPWQMILGDNANWVKANDTFGKQKYCPREVFDGYGMNVCPNSDYNANFSNQVYQQFLLVA